MRVLPVLAAAALLGACGGRSPVFAPESELSPSPALDVVDLPDPIPAAPAYRVELDEPVEAAAVKELEDLDGVAVVAPIEIERLDVDSTTGNAVLDVAFVDSLRYRPLAPAMVRDADFVWEALVSGKAVVTFDAAKRLGLGDPATIALEDLGEVAVGAVADFADPPVADVLLDAGTARAVTSGLPKVLMVGARTGTTLQSVKRDLQARLTGEHLTRLLPPSGPGEPAATPPEPQAVAGGNGVIPPMLFRILPNGFVDPDDAWVAANITTGAVPILGSVTCHRLMFGQLSAALSEIEQEGLGELIRPGDYGGCYVPRFIDRDPTKPLSMHAFGLAVDINVSTNGLGSTGDIDPRLVAIFEKWGFTWGGRWSRPDPMHFELARVVSAP